jgi:hypothetical protein
MAMGYLYQRKQRDGTMAELASDLRRYYELTGERQLKEADDRLKPLGRFFTGRRANLSAGTVQVDLLRPS